MKKIFTSIDIGSDTVKILVNELKLNDKLNPKVVQHIQSIDKKGDVVPMNYHFTTTKTHINLNGGKVVEIYKKRYKN